MYLAPLTVALTTARHQGPVPCTATTSQHHDDDRVIGGTPVDGGDDRTVNGDDRTVNGDYDDRVTPINTTTADRESDGDGGARSQVYGI